MRKELKVVWQSAKNVGVCNVHGCLQPGNRKALVLVIDFGTVQVRCCAGHAEALGAFIMGAVRR